MGKASAIPDHLFQYSDRGTQNAQTVLDWARTVLTPALSTYQTGAAHRATGANVDTGAVIARADTVHIDLPKQVGRAHGTDHDVRLSGNAFMRAGTEDTGSPYDYPNPFARPLYITDFRPLNQQVIQTTDEKVDGASWRAGVAAAGTLTSDTAKILKLLKANIDDPDFVGGFVQSLSPQQLKFLMKVVFSKTGYDLPDMTGLRTTPDGYTGEYEDLVKPYQKVVLDALTSGVQSMTPDRAKQLLGDVADALPKISPEQFAEIRPDLTLFLTVATRQTVPNLAKPGPFDTPRGYWDDTATPWAVHSGQNLAVLQKYADWIEKMADPGSERPTGLGVTIVLEVLTGAALLTMPELAIPVELGLHTAAGAMIYTDEGLITPIVFEANHPEIEQIAEILGMQPPKGKHLEPEDLAEFMKTKLQDQARLTVAIKAHQAGILMPTADGDEIWKAVDRGDLKPLAEKIREDPSWLDHQSVRGAGNLENLVAEVRNQWNVEPSGE